MYEPLLLGLVLEAAHTGRIMPPDLEVQALDRGDSMCHQLSQLGPRQQRYERGLVVHTDLSLTPLSHFFLGEGIIKL